MKVVHATASIAPRDGGPSTAVLGINRGLRELGVHSMIVSTDADGATGRLRAPDLLAASGPDGGVLICRRSRPNFLKHSWGQGVSLFHACPDPGADVIHVHGVYLANSIWAWLLSALRGTTYVVQPHGTLEPYQRCFGGRRKRLFDAVIGRRILAGAAAVIAASRAEAENLRALLPGAVVVTVPLGVTRHQPSVPDELRRQLSAWLAVPRSGRVLFLGRLATKKRPELLLDAWTRPPLPSGPGPGADWPAGQLLIAGPAQDWDAGTLRARIPADQRARVTFLDAVDPAAAAWLMTEAGIFVLPSENENFALSVAEAMSYGCAVITTEQTAASQHVLAAGAGVVLARPDLDLLRVALAGLLADPARAARLGEHGKRYAATELTWGRTACRLNETYHRLLTARRESAGWPGQEQHLQGEHAAGDDRGDRDQEARHGRPQPG